MSKRATKPKGGKSGTLPLAADEPILDVVDENEHAVKDESPSLHEEPGIRHTPIVEHRPEGRINDRLPLAINHSRDFGFYPAMSEDSFDALLSIIDLTVQVRDVISSLLENADSSEPDPITGLGLNIVNAIDMGLSNLAPQPLAVPEEISVANTALGIAEYVFDLGSSEACDSLLKLRDALNSFVADHPIDLAVNLNNFKK